MNEEIARFVRLQHAIRAAAQMPERTMAGEAQANSYDQMRDEVRALLPRELQEEYDRINPKINQKRLRPHEVMQQATAAATAKARLTTLSGWLDGYLEAEKASG